MANICCTTYAITGPVSDLKEIYAAADQARMKPVFSFADFLESLGLKVPDNIDLRESFNDVQWKEDTDSPYIRIYAEDFWSPKTEAWEIVRKKYTKVDIYYVAEEFGNDVFVTNDNSHRFFDSTVCIDWSDGGDSDISYFKKREDIVGWSNGRFGTGFETVEDVEDELEDILMDADEDAYVSIHYLSYDDWSDLIGCDE